MFEMTSQRKYQRTIEYLARVTNVKTARGSSFGEGTYFRCMGQYSITCHKTSNIKHIFHESISKNVLSDKL